MDYDAVVIGSGLGGLTAAAMVSHAGARVLVLERNAALGGAATTYHRGPLTVEASLHETTPPDAPGDPKRALFDTLGIGAALELVPIPTFQEVRWRGLGAPFQLPHGFDRIEAALTARFPDDRQAIAAVLDQVRRTQRIAEFADHSLWWKLRHAGELPRDLWAGLKDIRASLSAVFTRHFGDNEALKFALCGNLAYYADDPDTLWWMAFALAQGGYMQAGGYYIKGGSQRLTEQLVAAIRDAGGTVLTQSPAIGIDLNSEGAVAAVRYRQARTGAELRAPTRTVFANAAPHVVKDLLPAASRPPFWERFAGRPLSISLCSATLGLDRPPADLGVTSYSTILVPDWMERFSDFHQGTVLLGADPAGRMPVLCVVDYSQIDSGLVEDGLHPVNVVCADRLAHWQGLGDAAYQRRREAWLAAIIERLDTEWPGFAGAVKASTLSTARSMHAHLNTPEGAVYGFAMEPPHSLPRHAPRTLDTAVPGLWIASAYTGFGGFTGAIGGGVAAARAALRAGLSVPGPL